MQARHASWRQHRSADHPLAEGDRRPRLDAEPVSPHRRRPTRRCSSWRDCRCRRCERRRPDTARGSTASRRRSPIPSSRGATTQYYEMLGSRAIYHDGWMAVTWHRPGTDRGTTTRGSCTTKGRLHASHDLAAEQPELLAELIELWWDEARKHNVLPLDDRGRDRFYDPTRPVASEPRDVYRYYPGTSPIPEPVDSRHPQLSALDTRPGSALTRADDEGLIVSHGGSPRRVGALGPRRRSRLLNNLLRSRLFECSTGPLPIGREVAASGYHWEPTAVGGATLERFVDGRSSNRRVGRHGTRGATRWCRKDSRSVGAGDLRFRSRPLPRHCRILRHASSGGTPKRPDSSAHRRGRLSSSRNRRSSAGSITESGSRSCPSSSWTPTSPA